MDRIVYKEYPRRELWEPGPWDDEPDKVQWKDAHSGLPCLAVRGPMGSWCGYVGVGPEHPWYGKDYSACTHAPPCDESYCDHSPNHNTDVHGGLTFADSCDDPSPEAFKGFKQSFAKREAKLRADAATHPRGDSAELLKEWLPLLDDYEKWKAHKQAVSICHVAGPGDFEPAWWFGFDFAHSGDVWPTRKDWKSFSIYRDNGTYKTIEYVQFECTRVAKQLAEVKAAREEA